MNCRSLQGSRIKRSTFCVVKNFFLSTQVINRSRWRGLVRPYEPVLIKLMPLSDLCDRPIGRKQIWWHSDWFAGNMACKKGGPFEPPPLNCFGCAASTLHYYWMSYRFKSSFYLFLPPDTATVLERALVTNRFRLTPSFSARSTRAWCKDFGKRTVNLPLNFV